MNYYLINAVLLGGFQRAEVVNWQPVGPALMCGERQLCLHRVGDCVLLIGANTQMRYTPVRIAIPLPCTHAYAPQVQPVAPSQNCLPRAGVSVGKVLDVQDGT